MPTSQTCDRSRKARELNIFWCEQTGRSMPRCANTSRFAKGGVDGFSFSLVFSWNRGGWPSSLAAFVAAIQTYATTFQFFDVFRTASAELNKAPAATISDFARDANGLSSLACTGIRESIREKDVYGHEPEKADRHRY